MRPLSLATIGVLGAAASVRGQEPTDTAAAAVTPRVRALAGCYRLTVGPWRQGTPPHDRPQRPPVRFRLDTLALTGAYAGDFAATPPQPVDPATGNSFFASWRPAGDSVALRWGDGFNGVALDLVARGRALVGRARAYHDVRRRVPSDAAVRAVPAPCTSGEPPARRLTRR